jgi:MFS family permease
VRPDFPFRPARLPFFYGWVILGVSTVGIVMSIPGQTMGVSVFTNHLLEATGLTRLEMSNAYLVGTLLSGLLLPYGGTLVDRFGARPIVIGACFGLASTLCYLAQSDRIAAGLAASTPLGLGAAAWAVLAAGFTALRFSGQGMLTLVSRTMLGRWFERRRGMVAGISGPFVSFSFAGAPLLLSLWIAAAGWRGAWVGMALAVGCGMSLVGWLFYRDSPEQCGLHLDGRAEETLIGVGPGARAPRRARDFTRAEALRTAAFWLLTLGIANQAMVGTGITFHIVDLGAEAGVPERQAVTIFLPVAIVSTCVGLAAGFAIDRVAMRWLMMLMMLGQIVMFAGVAHLDDPWIRVVAIGGWGLASGFYGPFTVAAMPGFFGRAHLGAIQGVHTMCLVVASALGPSVLALAKGALGSYRPGLLLLCTLPLAVLLFAPFVKSPRDPVG